MMCAFALLLLLLPPAHSQGTRDLQALLDQGFASLESKRPAEARTYFRRALHASSHDNAEIITYIGVTYCDEALITDNKVTWGQGLDLLEKAATLDRSIKNATFLFYQASALRALGFSLHERAAWSELSTVYPTSPFAETARKTLKANQLEEQRKAKLDPEAVRKNRLEALVGIGLLLERENPYAALIAFTEVAVAADGSRQYKDTLNDAVLGCIRLWNRTYQHENVLRLKTKLRNLLEPGFATQVAIAEISLGRCPQAEALLQPLEGVPGYQVPLARLEAACRLVRNHQATGGTQGLQSLDPLLYEQVLEFTFRNFASPGR